MPHPVDTNTLLKMCAEHYVLAHQGLPKKKSRSQEHAGLVRVLMCHA